MFAPWNVTPNHHPLFKFRPICAFCEVEPFGKSMEKFWIRSAGRNLLSHDNGYIRVASLQGGKDLCYWTRPLSEFLFFSIFCGSWTSWNWASPIFLGSLLMGFVWHFGDAQFFWRGLFTCIVESHGRWGEQIQAWRSEAYQNNFDQPLILTITIFSVS